MQVNQLKMQDVVELVDLRIIKVFNLECIIAYMAKKIKMCARIFYICLQKANNLF